jgi:hypothetical protein
MGPQLFNRMLYLAPVLICSSQTAPAQCTYSLSSPTAYFSKAAGSGSFSVSPSAPDCAWTAVSSAPWLMITSSAAGTGQATVSYSVGADGGPGDYGTIAIGNVMFTTTQTTDNAGFVQQTFQDVLERSPLSAESTLYVGQLNSGVTRSQVAATIMTSPESVNNGLWLVKLYEGLLGRQADYGGWTYWYTYLHAGVPQDSLVGGFITSSEFTNRWGTPDNSGFVTEAYQFVLGRSPDTDGYNYWVAQLNSGLSRADLLTSFVDSAEYTGDSLALIEGNLLYLALLHRLPDTAGLTYWSSVLEQGTPLSVIVDGFLSSPEYAARY